MPDGTQRPAKVPAAADTCEHRPLPRTKEAADELITHIGTRLREIETIRGKRKARIQKLKEELAKLEQEEAAEIASIVEDVKRCASKVRTYAEKNRNELTKEGKKKTVAFDSGNVLQWNELSPQVKSIDEEKFFDEARRLDLLKFIKVKEEPDRQALLRDRDQADLLESVRFGRREVLRIKPAHTDRRLEADTGKSEWRVAKAKAKAA